MNLEALSVLNATVSERVDLAAGLFILRIVPDEGVADFLPGQSLQLGCITADGLLTRPYSIASSPLERRYVEFYVSSVRGGSLSPYLMRVGVGDRIHVSAQASGTFTLASVPPDAGIILIGSGTGLGPFMSMVRTPFCLEGRPRLCVLHGVRHRADLGYHDELVALASRNSHFHYLAAVSRDALDFADPAVQGRRLEDLIAHSACAPDPAADHVFLCGNPQMIDHLAGVLTERGFRAPHNLSFEKYW